MADSHRCYQYIPKELLPDSILRVYPPLESDRPSKRENEWDSTIGTLVLWCSDNRRSTTEGKRGGGAAAPPHFWARLISQIRAHWFFRIRLLIFACSLTFFEADIRHPRSELKRARKSLKASTYLFYLNQYF